MMLLFLIQNRNLRKAIDIRLRSTIGDGNFYRHIKLLPVCSLGYQFDALSQTVDILTIGVVMCRGCKIALSTVLLCAVVRYYYFRFVSVMLKMREHDCLYTIIYSFAKITFTATTLFCQRYVLLPLTFTSAALSSVFPTIYRPVAENRK